MIHPILTGHLRFKSDQSVARQRRIFYLLFFPERLLRPANYNVLTSTEETCLAIILTW